MGLDKAIGNDQVRNRKSANVNRHARILDHRIRRKRKFGEPTGTRTQDPRLQSWLVHGVRNDAFVRAYGAPVETEKTALERGRYQHPELYGASPDMAITRAKKPIEPAAGTTVHRPFPKN